MDAAGVAASPRGIRVDAHLRTSQAHIYAVGDVNGGPQFTHVAEDQARTVAGTLANRGGLGSRPAKWSGRVVPRVTYTDPEVAAVGLTEEQARRSRKGVRAWQVPLTHVDRAITMGQTEGFLKLVTARGWQSRMPGLAKRVGDEIVGACFVGPNAGDLLMPVVMAMRARLPIGLVAWNMQAYPTLSLGVRQVAGLPFES
ncbi:MAG: FAD-dependent oxidoreductase [Dehalococcoidia bacterium]|nr:FAD-dependent oxidoreductase [Dehalococcoidia bacterium]